MKNLLPQESTKLVNVTTEWTVQRRWAADPVQNRNWLLLSTYMSAEGKTLSLMCVNTGRACINYFQKGSTWLFQPTTLAVDESMVLYGLKLNSIVLCD